MAKASLAAQSGTLQAPAATQLPDIFNAPQDDIKGRTFPPYVSFANSLKKDEFKRIYAETGKMPEDGDMYLIEPKQVTPLPTLKCGWLRGTQCWVLTDESGSNILNVSYEEKPKPWKEQIEGVVLVYLDDRIVPANATFRTTKCGGALTLHKALALASDTAAWAALSEHHKATMVIQQPFWRFFGKLTVLAPRPPKGGGNPYRPTACDIFPVTPNETTLIAKFNEDAEAATKALTAAAERYAYRISENKAIFAKMNKA